MKKKCDNCGGTGWYLSCDGTPPAATCTCGGPARCWCVSEPKKPKKKKVKSK